MRYHLANTNDSYRVRLEQQLNQIIDLRTDNLGTVINSAYFKNNNIRFWGRNNTKVVKAKFFSQYDRSRHASESQRHPKD